MLKVIIVGKSINEDTLTRIRNTIKPLCMILEGNSIELWISMELSMIHKLVYEIITLIKAPVNIYVSDFVSELEPLIINGIYNRSIRLRSLSQININKMLIKERNIELLCYGSLSECLNKALSLMKEGFINSFIIRGKGRKWKVAVNSSKPIPLIIILKRCLKILKPKLVHP